MLVRIGDLIFTLISELIKGSIKSIKSFTSLASLELEDVTHVLNSGSIPTAVKETKVVGVCICRETSDHLLEFTWISFSSHTVGKIIDGAMASVVDEDQGSAAFSTLFKAVVLDFLQGILDLV